MIKRQKNVCVNAKLIHPWLLTAEDLHTGKYSYAIYFPLYLPGVYLIMYMLFSFD